MRSLIKELLIDKVQADYGEKTWPYNIISMDDVDVITNKILNDDSVSDSINDILIEEIIDELRKIGYDR